MKKLLFFGVISLFLSIVTSCREENLIQDSNILENDETFFINVSIRGSENIMGRADHYTDLPGGSAYNPGNDPEFDEGTSDENQVNSIYLIFYDSDGKRVSTANFINDLTSSSSNNTWEQSLYQGVVEVDVKMGARMPSYVLAIINPILGENITNAPDFETIDQVEKAERSMLLSAEGFAMSNSVYYGTDPISGKQNYRIMATPVLPSQFYNDKTSAQVALQANNGQYVEIYVERYAGKVEFALNSIIGSQQEASNVLIASAVDNTEVKLAFIPEYWSVNADEDVSYVTKNYFVSKGATFDFSQPADYATMNGILNWKWNNEEYHRSYWGQSPSYYIARYPRVSDDIMDQNGWTPGNKGDYELKYYSYNEMASNATDKSHYAKARNFTDNKGVIYTRENTVSGNSLAAAVDDPNASPKAAVASVVLVGHYEIPADNAGKYAEGFYIIGNKENGYKIFDKDEMFKSFLNHALKLIDSDGNPLGTENYEIKHPSKNVRGNIVLDSRYVTLQLKEENKDKEIRAVMGEETIPVTSENFDVINQNLMTTAGLAYGFKGGKAYFNIPIQHLGFYRDKTDDVNKDLNATHKDFNWAEAKSGDFGVVRNHMYKVIVDKIEGLGNAIPNEDDPIVPPTETEDYYIGARVVVLNWAVVPTLHVTI